MRTRIIAGILAALAISTSVISAEQRRAHLVVTAKGQGFERGMILDCWRHFGHLRWNLIPSDEDRYYENAKYAQFVRNRAAAKRPDTNRGVGLQTKLESGKTGR